MTRRAVCGGTAAECRVNAKTNEAEVRWTAHSCTGVKPCPSNPRTPLSFFDIDIRRAEIAAKQEKQAREEATYRQLARVHASTLLCSRIYHRLVSRVTRTHDHSPMLVPMAFRYSLIHASVGALSSRHHRVLTAVSLRVQTISVSHVDGSAVTLSDLSESEKVMALPWYLQGKLVIDLNKQLLQAADARCSVAALSSLTMLLHAVCSLSRFLGCRDEACFAVVLHGRGRSRTITLVSCLFDLGRGDLPEGASPLSRSSVSSPSLYASAARSCGSPQCRRIVSFPLLLHWCRHTRCIAAVQTVGSSGPSPSTFDDWRAS